MLLLSGDVPGGGHHREKILAGQDRRQTLETVGAGWQSLEETVRPGAWIWGLCISQNTLKPKTLEETFA